MCLWCNLHQKGPSHMSTIETTIIITTTNKKRRMKNEKDL